jgi:hypothetical protein
MIPVVLDQARMRRTREEIEAIVGALSCFIESIFAIFRFRTEQTKGCSESQYHAA